MHSYIAELLFIAYWGSMFVLAGFFLLIALFVPKKIKLVFVSISGIIIALYVTLFALLMFGGMIDEKKQQPIKEARRAEYEQARAVFDEQCKKAGEKIYRTVDNVDGVMLLKVRKSKHLHQNDPMFEDAGIIGIDNSVEGGYIASFFKHSKLLRRENAYQFVDVLKDDNSIVRYFEYNGNGDIDDDRNVIEKNPKNPARYAVTYENNVEPELRKHWVAGTTIKIIDRQTNELLAERTIFTFAYTMGNYVHGAWVDSRVETCPEPNRNLPRIDIGEETQVFAYKVLKPFQLTPSFNGDEQ